MAAVMVGLTMTAWAKKPTKPPKPPGGGGGSVGTGTIYYNVYNEGQWSMNPDGSGKTPLPVKGNDVSMALHPEDGGDRWFLQFQKVDGSYPITMLPAEFWWGNLDDLTAVSFTGDPNVASAWGNIHFYFDIDSVDNDNGDPDTFSWYVDFEGTRIEANGVDITGEDQELLIDVGNGTTGLLTINFASTTGHSLGSLWGIIVNKSKRSELFAVSEDGQIEVQLTYDPTVQPWRSGSPFRALPSWATDYGVMDGKISYLAQRWGKDGGEDVVVERGLFAAEIEWIDGEPYATTDTTMLPVSLPLEPEVLEIHHDWSPDGTQIVYSAGGIWVADAYVKSPGYLLCYNGGAPVWSPVLDDGTSLIAFRIGAWGDAEIRTISPDGSSETTIVTAGKNRTIRGDGIDWSPMGTHLVYTLIHSKGCIGCQNDSYNVYRVGADGSNSTNLTSGVKADCFSVSWR